MTELLQSYFEKELTYLQKALLEYGAKYPDEAKELGIHQTLVEDPSLSRMLEGMALLTSKLKYQLDNQFNKVINDLLGILFPIYNFILPSVVYLEYRPNGKLDSLSLPSQASFSVDTENGKSIFNTISTVNINPIKVANVTTYTTPFEFIRPKSTDHCDGLIQIKLVTEDEKILFSQLDLYDLEFFIHGIELNVSPLIDLLLEEDIVIILSSVSFDDHVYFDSNQFNNRITEAEFNFLPKHSNELTGYHQLFEFVNFKRKGQFFKFNDISSKLKTFSKNEIYLNIFVGSLPATLKQSISTETFKLNVFPAINLFQQRGEPITYHFHTLGIPIVANTYINQQVDIVDVLNVSELTSDGEQELPHMFDVDNKTNMQDDLPQWQSTRNNLGQVEIILSIDHQSSDVEHLVNLEKKVITTQLLCSNGFDACTIRGDFSSIDNFNLKGEVIALYPPSKPLPVLNDKTVIKDMLALLSCNFNTILQNESPTKMVKRLFLVFCRNIETSKWIENIKNIEFKHQVAPIKLAGKNIFASGIEIFVTLNNINNYRLFSIMFNMFFQQMCSFDRFIQLKIFLYGKDDVIAVFPRFHGSNKHF